MMVELLGESPGSRIKYAKQRSLPGPEAGIHSEFLVVPAAIVYCSEEGDSPQPPATMPTWHQHGHKGKFGSVGMSSVLHNCPMGIVAVMELPLPAVTSVPYFFSDHSPSVTRNRTVLS